jgi:peptidoglycan/xylan/chitin deacetylase (PgdA/CDA1 family)
MIQKVIPFQISIGPRASSGAHPVRAVTGGAETTTELELPNALLMLATRLLQPGVTLPVSDALALGRALGRALLAPPLRDMLLRSARAAARDRRRLQVQLQIAAPELAVLPWEWITLGVVRPWSPALRDDYALVRVGRRAQAAPPADVAGPLRVLAVASSSEELQLETLHTALSPAVHDGRIELRLLRDVTPQALEMALASDAPHILHCATPIGFTANGVPQLMIGRGFAAFDLAALAAESPGLRLVALAGPQGDGSLVSAAAPLLATTLVSDDLPATLAFGGPLPALLIAHFAAVCYGRLAEGVPVDLAVTAGRRALAEHAGGRGWGFPQLRLLPDSEQLFSFRRGRSIRLPRVGNILRQRWMMIPITTVLLLALLFAGRAFGPRGGAAASTSGAPQTGRGGIQPTDSPPTATPTDLPPMAAPTDSPTAEPAPTSYATLMTAAGDTLDGIAARMGSDAAAITNLNHLDPQEQLRPERPLVIPVFRRGAAGAGGLIVPRGDPARPQVALTFDIEIDDATLYGILDILRARGIHGTFFVTGNWVRTFPDAARAIVRDGHEIGNHSLTHPYFSRIGLDGAAAELEKTEKIIQETTGVTSRPYFRFPYGDSTANTVAIVAREGYVAYHWSADDGTISGWIGWAGQHKAEANGGVLLMHGRSATVRSLPGWLDQLAAMGLKPTTLGEVLR